MALRPNLDALIHHTNPDNIVNICSKLMSFVQCGVLFMDLGDITSSSQTTDQVVVVVGS